jgi:hypothetical protein
MPAEHCQFLYDVMRSTSTPSGEQTLWRTVRKLIWDIALIKPLDFLSENLRNPEPWRTIQKHLWHLAVFGTKTYVPRILHNNQSKGNGVDIRSKKVQNRSDKSRMRFKEGDLVEVKSFQEIFETLDKEGRHRGLSFTKEMVKFCGKQFKVFKRLDRIVLETTGEMRDMRTPTVLLEGVFCDGSAHGDCDRSCFAFWRDIWLKPVIKPEDETNDGQD